MRSTAANASRGADERITQRWGRLEGVDWAVRQERKAVHGCGADGERTSPVVVNYRCRQFSIRRVLGSADGDVSGTDPAVSFYPG
jgi:hypothetical protein